MSAALASARHSGWFRPAGELLASYALAHRDRRNIQTHLVGVPLNVLALGLLLGRPQWSVGPLAFSPAWACFALAATWYLTRGSLRIGLAVSGFVALLLLAAQQAQPMAVTHGFVLGFALLAVGIALQLVGHYYEGRRPASLRDPVNLLVGPMFVTVELLANFGFLRGAADEIERRAGPVHVRDLAHPAARH